MRGYFRNLKYRFSLITVPWQIRLILGLLILFVLLLPIRELFLVLGERREVIQAWIQSFGPLAPLAYITLYVVQILLAPVPGQLVSLIGGYLFGTVWGSLYSLVGVGLGAGLAAGLARCLGRPLVERLIGAQQLRRWERRLRLRSPLTWWLVFLLPAPDAVYYVAGLSGVPLRWMVLAALAGRGPGLVLGTWVGSQATELSAEFVLTTLFVVIVAFLVAHRHQRRVRLLLLLALRRARRLGGRFMSQFLSVHKEKRK